jgi:tRNA1(Val) A37 N6-methylase TrmN6
MIATSDDAVLGGRLLLRQPLRGHRVGHDAILLAAATGGKAGEHAIEFGAGVGAAGFALAQRVPDLNVTLVEIDPDLCALAEHNERQNKLADRVRVICVDVEQFASANAADRVLMNPPFNDSRRHNTSPDPNRRRAHVANPGLLPRWIAAADRVLRDLGVLTLIWRADDLDAALAALEPAFGHVAVLPILPREGATAIRVVIRALKGAAWSRTDFESLVLNDAANKPTRAAEAILREGQTLPLAALG